MAQTTLVLQSDCTSLLDLTLTANGFIARDFFSMVVRPLSKGRPLASKASSALPR